MSAILFRAREVPRTEYNYVINMYKEQYLIRYYYIT